MGSPLNCAITISKTAYDIYAVDFLAVGLIEDASWF